MDGRTRKISRWLPAAAVAAALAVSGPVFGDDISFNTEELTVTDCTTAWNGSDASSSCGASVSANGQSLDAATITVGKKEITIDYGLGGPPEVVGAIWWCEVAVDCMPDNKTAAETLADNLAVSTSFSGSKEDVGDLVNNNGSLEVE